MLLPGSSYLVLVRCAGTAGDEGFLGTGPREEREGILKYTCLHKTVLWQEDLSHEAGLSVGVVANLKPG